MGQHTRYVSWTNTGYWEGGGEDTKLDESTGSALNVEARKLSRQSHQKTYLRIANDKTKHTNKQTNKTLKTCKEL
jgi:6-phosphofructokinase